MTEEQPKAVLHRYLKMAREAIVWKLEGLSESEIRRPMVPTGTNLLGLVKHLGSVEFGYFGLVFGRPPDEPIPWWDSGADPNDDMWARASESRDQVVAFYRRSWRHSDRTIDELDLTAAGRVPWWPEGRNEPTLHALLIHVIAETNRHAGHADILRELIDGAVGLHADNSNLPSSDPAWWQAYRDRLEEVASQFDPTDI